MDPREPATKDDIRELKEEGKELRRYMKQVSEENAKAHSAIVMNVARLESTLSYVRGQLNIVLWGGGAMMAFILFHSPVFSRIFEVLFGAG